MVDGDSEFKRLMACVRKGDHDAAWEVIERYGPSIHRVVRRKLSRAMRQKYDSADFLQSVWKSFFRHPSRLGQFEKPEQLIRYLVAMARNKVIDETRRRTVTQAYSIRREESLDANEGLGDRLVSRQATPSQIAMARERWDRLMASLPSHGQDVIRLRVMGATYVEIAHQLHINERTARRVVERLTGSLQKTSSQ